MNKITTLEALLETPFKIDCVSRSDAPAGADGVWHRYVISQGENLITGVRAGSYAEVTSLLNEMVERLNERRLGKHRPKAKA